MDDAVKPTYEFGPFSLDLQKKLLLRSGVSVKLPPKTLDVLVFLIENRAEVVKKETLFDRFWPSLESSENNLTQAIHRIRQALGDTKEGHDYIVNRSGEGYQFVAIVRLAEIKPVAMPPGNEILPTESAGTDLVTPANTRVTIEQVTTDISIPDKPRGALQRLNNQFSSLVRRYPKATTVTLTGLGMVVLSFGAWHANYSRRPNPVRTRRVTTLVNARVEAGRTRQEGQLSHDGKMLAYSLTKDGRNGIWVKQINNSNPVPVTEEANSWGPQWSPNDLSLAYLSVIGKQIALWTKPALGGEATLITAFDYDPNETWNIELRAWSTIDPAKIYLERSHNLFRVDLNTKQIEQITSFDLSKDRPIGFEVSPDEKMITYVENKNNVSEVYLNSLNGTSPSVLSGPTGHSLNPAWLSDSSAVVYASKIDGFFQLFVTNIADRSTRQLTFDTDDHHVTTVSSTGTTVDLTERDQAHLWGVNLNTRSETLYTTEGGLQIWPEAVAGGGQVVFQSMIGTMSVVDSDIVSKELTGSRKTTKIVSNGAFFSVSPTGDQVAFLRIQNGIFTLWTAGLKDGAEKQLSTKSVDYFGYSPIPINRLLHNDPVWSPNGREIVFRAFKDDIENLWKVSLDTGIQTQITDNTKRGMQYSEIRYSPDGKKLAYVAIESFKGGNRIWSFTVNENGTERILLQRDRALRLLNWLPSGESLVFTSDEKPGEHSSTPTNIGLNVISIQGGEPKTTSTINSAYLITAAVSPNGQEVAMVCRHDGIDNIWISSLTDSSAQMITGNVDPTLYLTGLTWSPGSDTIFFSKQESVKIISLIDNLF